MKEWLLVVVALLDDGSSWGKAGITQSRAECEAAGKAFVAAPAGVIGRRRVLRRAYLCSEFLKGQEDRAERLRGQELRGAWQSKES